MTQMEIYQTDDHKIEVRLDASQDTVWLNRQQLAELFGRDIKTIGKHVNNVFRGGGLAKDSVVANFATTTLRKACVIVHSLRFYPNVSSTPKCPF